MHRDCCLEMKGKKKKEGTLLSLEYSLWSQKLVAYPCGISQILRRTDPPILTAVCNPKAVMSHSDRLKQTPRDG